MNIDGLFCFIPESALEIVTKRKNAIKSDVPARI